MLPVRLPAPRPASSSVTAELGGFHRLDRWLRDRASDLGLEVTLSPVVSLTIGAFVVAVVSTRVAGSIGLFVSVAGLVVAPIVLRRIADRRMAARLVADLPSQCTSLAKVVRAGVPLGTAVIDLADSEVAPELRQLGRQVDCGRPLVDALDELAQDSSDESIRLLSTALLVGEQSGGDLAATLEAAADAIRSELAAAGRRRVVVAQSVLSARVLAALPIVFAVFVSVVRDGPLFAGTVGAVSLVVGGILDALGLWWMHSLIGKLS